MCALCQVGQPMNEYVAPAAAVQLSIDSRVVLFVPTRLGPEQQAQEHHCQPYPTTSCLIHVLEITQRYDHQRKRTWLVTAA